MTTPEGKNTAYLKKVCKLLKISAFKQSFEGTVGAPDWLLCANARAIMIELKAGNGRLSPQQERMIDTLVEDGGFEVFVCSTRAEINKAIDFGLFGGANVTGAI